MMKTLVLAVLGVALPGLALAQSATYEVQGFPLSPHQAQVTGFAEVREQVAGPISEYKGFVASPTQMSVLAPRSLLAESMAVKSALRVTEPTLAALGKSSGAAVLLAAAWLASGSVASAESVVAAEEAKPYRVVDGKADRKTYNGYRRYNASYSHCHGPNGAGGSFGPSLTDIPAYDAFAAIVLYGRANGTSVMNGFADDPNIAPYVSDIYAYLRARSDGAIGRGRPVLDER